MGHYIVSMEDLEVVDPDLSAPEEFIDLSEYKFPKFAATYFQGNVTHTYMKKRLKHSLLPMKHEVDQLVCIINIIKYIN